MVVRIDSALMLESGRHIVMRSRTQCAFGEQAAVCRRIVECRILAALRCSTFLSAFLCSRAVGILTNQSPVGVIAAVTRSREVCEGTQIFLPCTVLLDSFSPDLVFQQAKKNTRNAHHGIAHHGA